MKNQTQFLSLMSEGMQKVHKSTEWSKNNFIPSFKETDKKLMETSKETFEMLKERHKEVLRMLAK